MICLRWRCLRGAIRWRGWLMLAALPGLSLAHAQPGAGASKAHAVGMADASTTACTLVLTEHRSRLALLRVPWAAPTMSVHFVHSVLGTPVEDHYVWRDKGWHLVEERFEGQGYGLPHMAATGEQVLRDGSHTRLLLNRMVMPLVIRPLPAQHMRIRLDGGTEWRLGELTTHAIELTAEHC